MKLETESFSLCRASRLALQRGAARGWWLYPLLGGLLLVVFCTRISSVEFHVDESTWVAISECAETFARGDSRSEWWSEQFWTLTQPPLAYYVIGIGRRAGGYGPSELNGPWDFNTDAGGNIAKGNMPSAGLLWWSRLPMAVLAVTGGLVLFGFAAAVAGWPAGCVFLFLYAISPYLAMTLGRAMSESVVLACISLAMLAGERALASWRRVSSSSVLPRRIWQPFAWLLVMGILSGAAASAKLNGGAVVLVGATLCVLVALQRKSGVPCRRRVVFATSVSVVLVLIAMLTFVLLNPYLYPDPLAHSLKLLQQRLSEMQLQEQLFPAERITGLSMWLQIVPLRILKTYAAIRFPGAWVPNLLLSLLGAGITTRGAWRWWSGREGTPASVVLLLAALVTATPALFTPLDWDRYYLLPVVFSTLFISVAVGRGVAVLSARLHGDQREVQA